MIHPDRERAAVTLLGLGAKQRWVARRVGISRGTVNAIALGRRAEDASQRAARQREARQQAPLTMEIHCKQCGGCGAVPCPICAARQQRAKRTAAQRRAEVVAVAACPPLVGLDLRPEHRARYGPIHRRKMAEEGMR
jgi:hypothetical protein